MQAICGIEALSMYKFNTRKAEIITAVALFYRGLLWRTTETIGIVNCLRILRHHFSVRINTTAYARFSFRRCTCMVLPLIFPPSSINSSLVLLHLTRNIIAMKKRWRNNNRDDYYNKNTTTKMRNCALLLVLL